jgi:hypothetical protein
VRVPLELRAPQPRGAQDRELSIKARCGGLSCSSRNIATRDAGRFLLFFAI